ncbi:DUF2752 domain-containing protein [Flagellimonas sp. 2504JD1-5]
MFGISTVFFWESLISIAKIVVFFLAITAIMYPQLIYFLIGTEDLMLPCLNKKLLGIDCPGCGMQRSIQLLFQGEFLAAFKMYPAIYPIFALLAFLGSTFFIKYRNEHQIKLFLILLTAATIVTSYIIKMNNFFN